MSDVLLLKFAWFSNSVLVSIIRRGFIIQFLTLLSSSDKLIEHRWFTLALYIL